MNYKDYISVEVKDPQFKAEIENVLEQLAQTPEGQALLTRAKLFNGGEPLVVKAGEKTEAHLGAGRVTLNREDLATTQFGAGDGSIMQASLNRVIFHELFHMADPEKFAYDNSSPAEQQQVVMSVLDEALSAYIKQEMQLVGKDGQPLDVYTLDLNKKMWVLEKMEEQTPGSIDYFTEKFSRNFLPHEKSAVAATNDFMGKYYGEEDRATYGASRKGTPQLEIHDDFLNKPQETEAVPSPPQAEIPMP